jgi:hypothetical protein
VGLPGPGSRRNHREDQPLAEGQLGSFETILVYEAGKRVDWKDVKYHETHQVMIPQAKEEPLVKWRFDYGGHERDIEYARAKTTWNTLNDWAGPPLEIRDEETDVVTDPTKVQPGRLYRGLQRIPEQKTRLYWDHSYFEIEWKGTEREFWKDLREYVDSRYLRLRGPKGWTDAKYANFDRLYTVRRFANRRTLIEVAIDQSDKVIFLDQERTYVWSQITRAFGKHDCIVFRPNWKAFTPKTLQDGSRYGLRLI